MITLQVADLVVIAGRALGVDSAAALDLVDLPAAEAALAATPPEHAYHDPGDGKHAVIFARNSVHRMKVESRGVAESLGEARRDY